MRARIFTEHVYPPIPDRRWDWQATFEDYEPGDPIGQGATEASAIADLLAEIGACETCGGPEGDCECPEPRICPDCGADEAFGQDCRCWERAA